MNNKYFGIEEDFALVKEDASRVVVSYDLQPEPDGEHVTWKEVYFYKTQGRPDITRLKDAVIKDINDWTDEKILTGYQWTVLHGNDAGKTVNVWLSNENKENYKAKYDTAKDAPELAVWPTKFKVSETEDKEPVYEYFADVNELKAFYYGGLAFIEQAVNDGWAKKDGIDWQAYEDALEALDKEEEPVEEQEEQPSDGQEQPAAEEEQPADVEPETAES